LARETLVLIPPSQRFQRLRQDIDWAQVPPAERPRASLEKAPPWYEETDLSKRRDFAWTEAVEGWEGDRLNFARGKTKRALQDAWQRITTIHMLRARLGLGSNRPLPGAGGGVDERSMNEILSKLKRIPSSRFRGADRDKVYAALNFAIETGERLRDDARARHKSKEASSLIERIAFEASGPTEAEWTLLQPWRDLVRGSLDVLEKTGVSDEGYSPGVMPRARLRWLLSETYTPWDSISAAPPAPAPPDPARGIFGRKLLRSSTKDQTPEALTFEELASLYNQGMSTTKKRRDELAQGFGFRGFSGLEGQLQDAAEKEGRYRVTLGTDSMWATREGVRKALSTKLGDDESLKFPREQLRAILYMSPAEFRDYQKAMRGKYTNPRAPGAARQVAASALKRRRTRAASTQRPGGTPVGIARARDIAGGRNLSPRTLARMRSFFARHDTPAERAARARDHMSPAAIAWDLWGGDPARSWLEEQGE
jgi:hypothetical protein